jgi:dTDP-4-amino-4,6-dideoxy-D-galactose acyltransferase
MSLPYIWKLDTFDSQVLGFSVARITSDGLKHGWNKIEKLIPLLIDDLKVNNVRYAVWRIPADDFLLIQALEKNGFLLIDGLMTLEASLGTSNFQQNEHVAVATPDDSIQLIALSKDIFNCVSRYYHDPLIPKHTADNVFGQWMENSIKGEVADLVLTWKVGTEVLGLVTLQKKGQISLLGVSAKARGKGVGKGLLTAAMHVFADWGLDKVVIETQISNIPALYLYQSSGFKIIESNLTFRLAIDE